MLMGYLTIGALNGAVSFFGGVPMQQSLILAGVSAGVTWISDFIADLIYTYLPGGLIGMIAVGSVDIAKLFIDALVYAAIETYVPGIPKVAGRTLFQSFLYQIIILMVSHGVLDLEKGFGLDF